jgi:hypothetical protein
MSQIKLARILLHTGYPKFLTFKELGVVQGRIVASLLDPIEDVGRLRFLMYVDKAFVLTICPHESLQSLADTIRFGIF